ncbi:MAG: AAA family ATPase [Bacteroidales bacterium]|nr:AAA family ATPase [Bacteroidales bacterium]
MRTEQFKKEIITKLRHDPTAGQISAIDGLCHFTLNDFQDEIFVLCGYAGTGKTSLIASVVKSLNTYRKKSVLLAPTGRAAKVLSGFAGASALTIHKKIYRQKKMVDGFAEFGLDRNLHKNTLFLVDEASMIANQSLELSVFGNGRLLDDLISYVYSGVGCKLVLIGDTAQLPPVGLDISDALDPSVLEGYGFEIRHHELTDVVRQSVKSGILENATSLRVKMKDLVGNVYPGLNSVDFEDFRSLSGVNLIDEIQSSYDKPGMDETMIVCRSNKQANRYNQGVRNTILWREEEISTGDQLMVVKNNYYWLKDEDEIDFIANGDILEITRVLEYKDLYDLRFARVVIRLKDYRDLEFTSWILLDTLTVNGPALNRDSMRDFFFKVMQDYQYVKGKKHRMDAVREDQFFNALQVKYAYAITCHKAQGGQWKNIYIDQGYITEDKLNLDYYRWLYTAITRATEKVYLVNFREEFLIHQ